MPLHRKSKTVKNTPHPCPSPLEGEGKREREHEYRDIQHSADYAMAFDLVAKIAGAATEHVVIEKVFGFLSALCAPARLAYLPFTDKMPGDLYLYPESSGGMDFLKARLKNVAAAYEITGSGKGFIVRIPLEDELLGVFMVDEIAFPEYLQHYVNLCLHLASSIALAVSNARYFERLQMEISERRRTEDGIRRRNLILKGINRIFQDLPSLRTEEELGSACLRIAEEITGSRFGFIAELGPDGLLHDIAISDPGCASCSMHARAGHRGPPTSWGVLKDGKSFFTNEPAIHPDKVGLPSSHPPLTAFLGAPLMHEGRVVGMIAMGNRDSGYTHEQQEALKSLAPAIVEAFNRKRAEDSLQKAHTELATANKELESFVYSVSHDLRAPLRSISGFSDILLERYSSVLDDKGKRHLNFIVSGAAKMDELIDNLLRLSRVRRQDLHRQDVDMSKLAQSIVTELCGRQPGCRASVHIGQGIRGHADLRLIEVALSNLLANAFKFTTKTTDPRIEFGTLEQQDGKTIYYISDNGVGFDQTYADRLFQPFQRLHSEQEFEGTGIGLAIVETVIRRHGGKIWAEGKTNKGATFLFTLQ